jgi:hypothetical protein
VPEQGRAEAAALLVAADVQVVHVGAEHRVDVAEQAAEARRAGVLDQPDPLVGAGRGEPLAPDPAAVGEHPARYLALVPVL